MRIVPESRYRYRFPYVDEMPASLLHPQNPYLDSLLYECTFRDRTPLASQAMASASSSTPGGDEHQGAYLKPFHAAEVVDPKLELIKPSGWTSVCSDDRSMRKLFNIYFLQEYHAAPFFHKDYFLEDMIAGRHGFCSSLLVNAILAMACVSCLDIYSGGCLTKWPISIPITPIRAVQNFGIRIIELTDFLPKLVAYGNSKRENRTSRQFKPPLSFILSTT